MTKYLINIFNDKTGEILIVHKNQCEKNKHVCSSYVVYIIAIVEPKPSSYVLQKIVVKDVKWDDYLQ